LIQHPDVEMEIYSMEQIMDAVALSDVVYTSTASDEPMIWKKDLEAAQRVKPLVLVDISVPRNVEKVVEALHRSRGTLNTFIAVDRAARKLLVFIPTMSTT
jgi:glutamyl-tRNA reductase